MHGVLQGDLHMVSTCLMMRWESLSIESLLDFGNLVTEDEIEFKVLVDFLDAMHDGGMVFNANFDGNFGGAETEFLG